MPGVSHNTYPAIDRFRAAVRRHDALVESVRISPAAEHIAELITQSLRVMQTCDDIIASFGVDPVDCALAVRTVDNLGPALYAEIFELVRRK